MSTATQIAQVNTANAAAMAQAAGQVQGSGIANQTSEQGSQPDFMSVISQLMGGNNIQSDSANGIMSALGFGGKNKKGAEQQAEMIAQLLAQNPTLAGLMPQLAAVMADNAALTAQGVAGVSGVGQDMMQMLSTLTGVNIGMPITMQGIGGEQNAEAGKFDELINQLSANQNVQVQRAVVQNEVQAAQQNVEQATVSSPEIGTVANVVLGAAQPAQVKENNKLVADTRLVNDAVAKGEIKVDTPEAAIKTAESQSNIQRVAIQAKTQAVEIQQTKAVSSEQNVATEQAVNASPKNAQEAEKASKVNTDDAFMQKLSEQVQGTDTMQKLQGMQNTQETLKTDEGVVLDKKDLLNQVVTGAVKNANAGAKDFVMTLRPEGLGEITVKMTEQQGHLTMQLTTSNQSVQKMLTTEIEQLREAMKPYRVEIAEVSTKSQQQFTFAQDNSAAQQQHGRQLAQQFEFARQQQNASHYYGYTYNNAESSDEEIGEISAPQSTIIKGMDRYI